MVSNGSRKLVLVDGNSLFYRSFFAIPRLNNRRGIPTNAVYGFATVLRKILKDEEPAYAAVVFDAGGRTFRHQIFDGYKAQRPETPDDLVVQLPYARRVCSVLGLPMLEIPNVEADDIVATLACRAEGAGHHVFIVSSDKDFLQLVSDRVTVIHPGKDTRYDPAALEERFGVGADKIVDIQALVGDGVDNIPGVPGIGEKGAVALIREWGSLEAVLANAERIKNKRQREGLLAHAEEARLSRRLVSLERNVPLPIDLESLRYAGANREQAFALFDELEFTSLLKEYAPEPAAETAASYELVETPRRIEAIATAASAAGRLAVSFSGEEAHPARARIRAIGLAWEPGRGYSIPLDGPEKEREALARLGTALSDPQLLKIGHDLKAACVLAAARGVPIRGIGFDTSIASYVLNPNKRSHSLETLAFELLHRSFERGSSPSRGQAALPGMEPSAPVSTEELLSAAERAEAALRLTEKLAPRIEEEELQTVFREIELPLVPVLAEMERVGIALDVAKLREIGEELGRELDALTRRIYELAGTEFNINSPRQLGEILFEKMNLPSFRKTQKQRQASTRMDVLEELAPHWELPKRILEYRTLAKLKGTYVEALPALVHPDTGRIHTSFNQTVAATGRLSSSDPNLQNIPVRSEVGRRIRSAFVAQPGWLLLSADYSQIELRVLAHLSGEPALVESFRAGEDIHDRTARRVFGPETPLPESELRRRAKIINFGILYGKTAYTLAKDLNVSTREAQAFIDNYFAGHPKVRDLLDQIVRDARRTGKVRTLFGRQRYIAEIASRNRATRAAAERIAVNAPIQGTAADLIKKAMVDLWRELGRRGLGSRLLLQVHDELLLEVPEAEAQTASRLVREIMENVHPMAVPLRVDVSLSRCWEK